MKEIIKKRWNRYKQLISIFSIIFTVGVCCVMFFMSLSDAGFRSLIDREAKLILFILIGRFFIEVIGAMLEFRQKIVKKDHNN